MHVGKHAHVRLLVSLPSLLVSLKYQIFVPTRFRDVSSKLCKKRIRAGSKRLRTSKHLRRRWEGWNHVANCGARVTGGRRRGLRGEHPDQARRRRLTHQHAFPARHRGQETLGLGQRTRAHTHTYTDSTLQILSHSHTDTQAHTHHKNKLALTRTPQHPHPLSFALVNTNMHIYPCAWLSLPLFTALCCSGRIACTVQLTPLQNARRCESRRSGLRDR